MKTLLMIMIVALVSNPAKGENRLTGAPKIITGDTLEIAGRLVHLVGVDAPEMAQRCRLADGRAFDCGLVAKTALMDLTVGGPVSCTLQTEQAIPPIALCKAGGYDLSKGMAHTGWALAWPRKGTVSAGLERYARQKIHGLWKGRFVAPWDWRRGQREQNLGAGKPE
jgi:endonuclease YncB( thermonuclease family)